MTVYLQLNKIDKGTRLQLYVYRLQIFGVWFLVIKMNSILLNRTDILSIIVISIIKITLQTLNFYWEKSVVEFLIEILQQ